MKLAIIGCGRQGERHLAGLRESRYAAIPVVVADLHASRSRGLAARFHTCDAATVDAALADRDVGAALICTPTMSHAALCARALQAGKHVLCEKPLCDSLSQAARLHALARQADRVLAVGYIYRHAPRLAAARAALVEDSFGSPATPLGKVLTAWLRAGGRGDQSRWKHQRADGGGAVNEMLVHMIDLGIWIFGRCERVHVLAKKTLNPVRSIAGETFSPDTEDFVIVKMACAGGLEYFIEADLATPGFVQYLDVVGENGNLFTSILPEFPSYLFLRTEKDGYPAGRSVLGEGPGNYYVPQIEAFLDATQGRPAPSLHRAEDSLEVMRLIDEVACSGHPAPPRPRAPRSATGLALPGRRSWEG
ncbi:MAG TPA: Gfo/Idh/MocA family oxidoreductase [Noviherbaspirillum sp.]|nr:Gfo/Idh/MocA family oxidoreductase [Noviherbaspirillum sp.]